MKTFIHHNGALGDILLSLPCFRVLQTESDFLHITGRRDAVEFLKEAGVVSAAISSDLAFFASLYSDVDNSLRTFLKEFDRGYVFSSLNDSAVAGAIRSCIPHVRQIGTIPSAGSIIHVAEYRLSQVAPGVRLSAESSTLHLSGGYIENAEYLLTQAGLEPGRTVLAIHAGSGGMSKCWPLDYYFTLVEHLQSAYDPFILIFSGPAEDEVTKTRIDSFVCSHNRMLHAADFRPINAAALLCMCDLYIGNDSGFSHLAGTVCPILVLFGPTDSLLWRPVGSDVHIISPGVPGPVQHISLEAVVEKAGLLISGKLPA